ncbi:MAG: peptidase S8/S53 domain-containing protein [Linnemannia elongata]|nr:MAG: peptidase S8/S53 domain-containing protein [Linnemannia elongata]
MRTATRYTIFVLYLSAAIITAAPIESVPDANELIAAQQRQQQQQTPFAFLEQEGSSFEALATPPPSSFLIEFNLPPAGVNRHERMRMEETGEFQGFTANRHANVAMQHQNFQDFMIDQLKVDFAVRHEFFDLMNGISIDLQGVPPHKLPQILEQIRDIPDVVNVSPLISMSQPKSIVHDVGIFDAQAEAPQLSTAHEQTGVLSARNERNLTGKGIKVGVIDTGVDYTHEAFGSCYGGPGCKIQYGFDFVEPNRPMFQGGFDCVGHGTHVAGIIAGNSTKNHFLGVAPDVTLGVYRVFPCKGSSKDDVIIAALEKAYSDGMDVVNLSLGGGSSWADTSLSKVAGSLANLGVVVVAAIGNDGELGIDEVSSPSINRDAISVASFEGSGYLSNYFQVKGASEARIDFSDSLPKDLADVPLPLVLPTEDIEGCKSYNASLDGTIALIRRGTCSFVQKIKLAQDAGAIGCIFYNNVEGGLRPKVDDPSVRIFGHGISQSQGQLILDQFDSGRISKVEVIYKAEKGVFRNEMADQISTFSSWGLGPELELKPDVGAPGGYIYSTIPVVRGSYSTMSGTSMATPFVAGTAALILQADPTIDRHEVLGRLQIYAKPGLYKDTQIADSVARQGAGMVNVWDAIRGQALVEPTRLALNDTDNTLSSYTLTVTNQYETAETFVITHIPAQSVLGFTPIGLPSDKVFYNESSALLMVDKEDKIRLEPGETGTFTFHFDPPSGLDIQSHWIFSGYVKIAPSDTSRPAMQVPYAGMHGSYNTVDILNLQENYPIIAGPTSEGRLMPITFGEEQPRSYTMVGRNIVTMLLKISNPMRNLQIYVMDATTHKVIGMVPVDGEYVGRTDNVKSKFFVVPFAGRMIDGDGDLVHLGNGDYSLVVVAPKPFSESVGLSGGPHESWMSPIIRIKH